MTSVTSVKHTAGPWHNEYDERIFSQDVVAGEKLVAEVFNGHADACLIAAAPEMLEALEAARPFIGCGEINGHTDNCIFRKVDAAIRRARGER